MAAESRATPVSDETIAAAVKAAASRTGEDLAAEAHVNEDRVRKHLCAALADLTDAAVEPERHIEVPCFQGVGPVDIVLRAGPGGEEACGLIECKWSTSISRDKIFESAWDAVKLALAIPKSTAGRWLVTGAPSVSWDRSETSDLFVTGEIHVGELWGRKLYARGHNGGWTVGEDCEAGGRGNVFTHAPERISVRAVSDVAVPGAQARIRVARVRAVPGPLIRFHDDPEFPALIRDQWLVDHVPLMPDDQFERLVQWLNLKRWTESDIAAKVLPYRHEGSR